ncbi:transcription factor [Artomyces pyxidatus]|uniref:Transcription factor n=1 Tax=Artomyces pyxidatus TaxID=48021 RepID=A0ACB8THL5_9AGAM|nr:transcription factor [Artomyces pyxidatus]
MADMDVFAAMGIAGFGKKVSKKQLDAGRFDKNKRQEVCCQATGSPGALEEEDQHEAGPSRSMGPPALPTKDTSPDDDDGSDDPGPPPPPTNGSNFEGEPEFDPDQNADEDADMEQFPISHELMLKDHTKVISALALDPSGARIVSGSHDYDCKLWDFGGMGMSCKPFKTWEPAGSYHIHDIKFSNDGRRFLVVSGTTQAKLYDRDGEEKATYVKGDMYIRDMKNTAGHVGELSSCAWHPKDADNFITSSADSTIRIWDVENRRKQKTVIVVKSKERGTRTKVTACNYSPDGRYVAGACLDGTLHLWKTNSNLVRPDMTVQTAHTKGTETGSLVFSVDGNSILTRGGDDTVKLWDLRSFKKPVAERSNVLTLYPSTNAIFSPDNKYVVTGAGASGKGGKGSLLFLRRDNLEVEKQLEVDATPVVVQWHPKINQIVTGLTNGQICVLYSPQTSLNGAKLLLNKGPAKKPTIEDMSDALAAPTIITPHALPMFRDGEIARGSKRKRERDRQDPQKSRRPELPVTGPGRGGRVGASATQHVVQNLVRDTTRDEDPREALLKFAKVGEEDPQWTGAWRVNQPKPVFAEVEEEKEDEETL